MAFMATAHDRAPPHVAAAPQLQHAGRHAHAVMLMLVLVLVLVL